MKTNLRYVIPQQELTDGITFDQRRRLMCEYIGDFEGTELGDGITSLCCASATLSGINCDHEADIALILAEKLCREFVQYLRDGNDPDQYKAISDEVFKHFTGGAEKQPTKK